MPRKPSDRVKTDRRDALMIAQLLRGGNWMLFAFQKFLLRHGHMYPGNWWTVRHGEWLESLDLGSEVLRQTFTT